MKVDAPDFYVQGGVSYKGDYLGNYASMIDSAQPNPDYVHNPGIHGWIQGKYGLERIDVEPGEEIDIPSLQRVESLSPISLDSFMTLRADAQS